MESHTAVVDLADQIVTGALMKMARPKEEISLVAIEKIPSPYYNEYHKAFRLHVREFVEREMPPHLVDKWEKQGSLPARELTKKMVAHGIYNFPWNFGDEKFQGQDWDPFFQIVYNDEIAKTCMETALSIHWVCVPPLIHFGNEYHQQVAREIMNGDKLVSLAISELTGGSDVAQLKTTAVLDGDEYVINGNKYWISAGARADYFVTMVRTGTPESGRNGLSLILIPRGPGVYTSRIDLMSGTCTDTAAVTFTNVRVPRRNLIHKENQGFMPLMQNFNIERFALASGCVSQSILCVEEAMAWAKERKTFGKRLADHQVIRHKIADMARRCLSARAFLESVAYQMKLDPLARKDRTIAANIALLKVEAASLLQYCTIEASQIFGGRSFVKGGRGGKIERAYRLVRSSSIAGGSSEIMYDLAARQAKL